MFLLRKYNEVLMKRPILTKSLTGGTYIKVLFYLRGDILSFRLRRIEA